MSNCQIRCPVQYAAEIIEKKWMTLIFRELYSGKKRFSELHRSLKGISKKVLSERLSFLEERKLVGKTLYPSVPPTTEYWLSESGLRFGKVLDAMAEFGHAQLVEQNSRKNKIKF